MRLTGHGTTPLLMTLVILAGPLSHQGHGEPVDNAGPVANSLWDSHAAGAMDADTLDRPVASFTAHRSLLGLVFDNRRQLGGGYTGGAFILSFSDDLSHHTGVAPADTGQDMLQLRISREPADRITMTTRRLISGFRLPIDAAQAGRTIYVLEFSFGGEAGRWAVSFPATVSVRRELRVHGGGESTAQRALLPFTTGPSAGRTFYDALGRSLVRRYGVERRTATLLVPQPDNRGSAK